MITLVFFPALLLVALLSGLACVLIGLWAVCAGCCCVLSCGLVFVSSWALSFAGGLPASSWRLS